MMLTHRQQQTERLLHSAGILPVVAVDTLDQARGVANALLEGGLPVIELTLRTPVAMEALATLKKELPGFSIGAGTVLTIDQIGQCIGAGADFLVTPGTPAALAESLATAPIPVVPGAGTATELLTLLQLGFHCCKLFPATAVGGLAMIKGLHGPVPQLKLCPTGGITEATAAEYLSQPNVACIGGSWMVPKDWIAAGEWAQVRAAAARAEAIVRQVRGG
ncbi:MAG: bifunctional 4-hydroxy-2-oxoglutarate aldolase/2-dehydro-3-deoxy-phosphogluconate aldolase [Pseudoxanthomonas sp.]